MKLFGFANFVEQHLVPYEYPGISLVVIEAFSYHRRGFYCMMVINKLHYVVHLAVI